MIRRLRPVLAIGGALLPLGACRSGVDLTPPLEAGTRGTVAWEVVRTVRVVVAGNPSVAEVRGTRTIEIVDGGALGSDLVVMRETGADLSIARDGEGFLGWTSWSSEDDTPLPDLFQGFAPLLEVDRTVTFRPASAAGGPTIEAPPFGGTLEFEAGAEMWFEALVHAPTGRVREGDTWHHAIASRDGVPWFRQWTVLDIADGVALLESLDRPDDPVTGDPGPVEQQARSRVEVDVATGLPRSFRRRDLTRRVLAGDVTATITWE